MGRAIPWGLCQILFAICSTLWDCEFGYHGTSTKEILMFRSIKYGFKKLGIIYYAFIQICPQCLKGRVQKTFLLNVCIFTLFNVQYS